MTKKKILVDSSRMWASASFVGVLIIIGLPLWWKTTEVYRVPLPFLEISSFRTQPHKIATELTVLANDAATASEVAGLIETVFEQSDVLTLRIKTVTLSDDLHHTLNSVSDEEEAIKEIGQHYDLKSYNRFYVVQRSPLLQEVWAGPERVMMFRDSKAATKIVQALQDWIYQTAILEGAISDSADEARQTRFPPGSAYHIVLSVVQPAPDKTAVDFDAREAVEDYIGSFVDELSDLHNFTLKSQWLHLLDFDFQAKQIQDDSDFGSHYAVPHNRLHLLLTRLEERAATHVSEKPTINLVLYATPCHISPLILYDAENHPVKSPVQAFMSPKWGGVVISNPTAGECSSQPAHRPVTRVVMGTFLAHLRTLLGIADNKPIPGAHLVPLRSVAPRGWEVDALLRLRTLEQLVSAENTLHSLAQLLGEISNIVINDEVGASINSAVQSIARARQLAAEGRLLEAYQAASDAFNSAETAFMEPSLLALLYFPDDQKYAIYIPLFLPIMFPVVLSLKNLVLWIRGKPIHQKDD